MADRGTLPPVEVLKSWPKPNYINPENQTAALLGTVISLSVATTIVMLLRLYSRGFLTKSIGADDWLMAAALVAAIGMAIANCLSPQWGWGVHLYDFKAEWIIPARKLVVATELLFIPCVVLTKISILVFYRRVFSSSSFRWLVNIGIGYTVAYFIASTCVVLLQAIPLNAYWDKSIHGTFIKGQVAFSSLGVLNCLSDIYIFALPIQQVWAIKLPQKQRIGLIGVFSLGLIVCVAGVVRIYLIWKIFDSNNWDFTYDGVSLYIVTALEGYLGILCASLPALKPLIHRYAPALLGSSFSGSRPSGPSPSYRLGSYAIESRRRDTKRMTGVRVSKYTPNSVTCPTQLESASEENILPIQGVVGWEATGNPGGRGNGTLVGNGIGKKVDIEVVVEDVIPPGAVWDWEKQQVLTGPPGAHKSQRN